ncbi:MAG: universal stress protein [Candidatus Aquicultor sp.]
MRNRPAVILPLDGSEIAVKALGAAEAMTNIMGAVLYIVHVTEELLSERDLVKKLKIGQIEVRDFSLHQIQGVDAADEILRFAASVDTQMIVMSSHGWTFNTEHLLGSTTTGIVQRAINPVMIIRPDIAHTPDPQWKPKKMLVPQDGSPTAAAVMIQVFNLAKRVHAEVDVLNIGVVGEKPSREPGTITPPRYVDYPRYDWPAWAQEFVERFYAQRPLEVSLKLFEREGEPADVMLKFAQENGDDLIALGWHGHLEERRATTVKELLRRTDIPVLLIWSRE